MSEHKFIKTFTILFIVVTIYPIACSSTSQTAPSIKTRFENLTKKNLPKDKRYKSILVGIVTPFETKILSFGDEASINNQTIFEIGSITKGFLGLALARAVIDHRLHLSNKFTQDTRLKIPQFQDTGISWKDLASHTSGLPRVPDNLQPKDSLQPYINYKRSSLVAFLDSYTLLQAPGLKSEYSNTGAGIVGLGLEKIYAKTLTEIFNQKITQILNMPDTQIFLSPEQQNRITPVYLNGNQRPYWTWRESSVLQGAGALKSTMTDMIKFIKVMMGLENSNFWPTVKLATQTTFTQENSSVGLFWQKLLKENIIWLNGGTLGSSSFIGFDPDKLVGIVVLSNSQLINEKGIDSRLDLAAIETLLDLQKSSVIERPLKILKDYDTEIYNKETNFNKTSPNPKDMSWVKSKLNHMVEMDQVMRSLINKPIELLMTDQEKMYFQKAYNKRFYLMDYQNTQDMKDLLKLYGWFNISQWGVEADRQGWLLVQHADEDPEFQKEVLKKLTSLYKGKETKPSNYAYLWDRVALSKGVLQRYGTQGQCACSGKWEPFPIENEKNVDKLRKEVGFPTMAEYKKKFKEICK